MRLSPAPAALGQQLAEWRRPLDADPDVDAAMSRMLTAIDQHLQREEELQEEKV